VSTHKVEVVRLGKIERIPNADLIGSTKIWGYTAIVRLADFKEGDLVIYVEPDYVLPDKPEYAFLKGSLRIKARRFKGVWSQGLVIAVPPEMQGHVRAGDDVMEKLGITRYVPATPGRPGGGKTGGDSATPPVRAPVYDLESFRRYSNLVAEGEEIVVTEKIHGCNARFVWKDGRMHCGSRTRWVKPPRELTGWENFVNKICTKLLRRPPRYFKQSESVWWSALKQNPWVEEFCKCNSGVVVYGEVFGQVQDLKYGAEKDQYFVRVFDAYDHVEKRWINYYEEGDFESWEDFLDLHGAPILYRGPHKGLEHLEELSRRDSVICPGQLSEGIVVRPVQQGFERVVLKLVSDRYLERA